MFFSKDKQHSLHIVKDEILNQGETLSDVWLMDLSNGVVSVKHIYSNLVQDVFVQDLYILLETQNDDGGSLYYSRNTSLNTIGTIPLHIVLYNSRKAGIDMWKTEQNDCKNLEKQITRLQIYLSTDDADVVFSYRPSLAVVARASVSYATETKQERCLLRHLTAPLAAEILNLQNNKKEERSEDE